MSKNPYGTLTRTSKEWGKKARKREDHQRGMRHRGLADALTEAEAETNEDWRRFDVV